MEQNTFAEVGRIAQVKFEFLFRSTALHPATAGLRIKVRLERRYRKRVRHSAEYIAGMCL